MLKAFNIKKIVSLLTALSFVFSIFGITVIGSYTGEAQEAENVILLIGDGMGYNHWELCKQQTNTEALFVETGFDYYGYSQTRSLTSSVTDSAAGGTALATGIRTYNGAIGVYLYNPLAVGTSQMNLCELAISKGMKTGIVTSDSNTGATPAAFSAHTCSRSNDIDIAEQQLASGIDLIWSTPCGCYDASTVSAAGYTLVTNTDELNALPANAKSIGQFGTKLWARTNDDNCPTLSQLTESAIERLDNTDGFFLMVEGAHIDKHSHDKDAEEMAESMLEFDKAIEAAVDFAEADGNTIVIVTADHETGGIIESNGKYSYTIGSHSGTDVPLCVYGTDDFIEAKQVVCNVDIPVFISRALGASEEQFPAEVDTKFNAAAVFTSLLAG